MLLQNKTINNQELIEKFYLESTKGIKEDWFVSEIPHWYVILLIFRGLQTTYLTVLLIEGYIIE